MPDQGAVFTRLFPKRKNSDEVFQTPIYLSNIQPNLADKETFMQNSLSPQSPVEVDYSNDPSAGNPSTGSAFNQSPERRVLSEPLLNGNANREKVVPINDASANGAGANDTVGDAHQLAALSNVS